MLKRSVVFGAFFGTLACGGEDSLDRYERAASRLYDANALAQFRPEPRAYVMGHALGVYLYSRTLPAWIDGSGYKYEAGASARDARVGYDFKATVAGDMDDVPSILPGDECYRSGDDIVCPDPPVSTPPPSGNPGDEPVPADPRPGDETPPGDDSGDPGDPAEPHDDPNDPSDCDDPDGHIDDDCESFLDPAAMQARAIAARVDVEVVLAYELGAKEAAKYREVFERGIEDALALEDRREDVRGSEPQHLKKRVRRAGLCEHSPIVLDLDGDGISLSDPKGGVFFDLREKGHVVRTAWPTGGDALLVFDRDGDGRITSGGELFGNSMKDDGSRWGDGFASLAALDVVELGGNGDGVIDLNDEMYARLAVWRDTARDGASEESELVPLAEAGVVSLSVTPVKKFVVDKFGNTIPLWGEFIREEKDGALVRGTMADAWFRIRAAEIGGPLQGPGPGAGLTGRAPVGPVATAEEPKGAR